MTMMKNKKAVLRELRKTVGKEIERLRENMEGTKARMIDAPGAMQSHHDTSKVELGWLMDGFAKRAVLLEGTMGAIDRITTPSLCAYVNGKIVVGSLVRLKCEDGNPAHEMHYLIVPDGQGRKVEYEGAEAIIISPTAPIAAIILGKEVGDIISIKGKEMMIAEIA